MKKVNFKVANMKAKSGTGFIPEKKPIVKKEENVSPYTAESYADGVYRVLKNAKTVPFNSGTPAIEVKSSKFKIGDTVRLISNVSSSVNSIGDIGTIVQIQPRWSGGYQYKVNVPDELYLDDDNWSREDDLVEDILVEIEPPTDEEVLNSIDVVYDERSGFVIRVINRRKTIKTIKLGGSFAGSNISCGINQFSGLNSIFDYQFLLRQFEAMEYSHLMNKEFFIDLVTRGFRQIFERKRIGFLLMSTNINRNDYIDDITRVLDTFKNISWTDTHNRNSDNNIRLWICDLYKFQTN